MDKLDQGFSGAIQIDEKHDIKQNFLEKNEK